MNFVIFSLIRMARQMLQKRSGFLFIPFCIFSPTLSCFRQNKSVLKTRGTKHADSKLHFATKNIEFHLLVFENQLNEDAMHAAKK